MMLESKFQLKLKQSAMFLCFFLTKNNNANKPCPKSFGMTQTGTMYSLCIQRHLWIVLRLNHVLKEQVPRNTKRTTLVLNRVITGALLKIQTLLMEITQIIISRIRQF